MSTESLSPIEIAVLAILLIATVAGMSFLILLRARWAGPGGLELGAPTDRTETVQGFVGALFIGTVVAAGILGNRQVAAVALGVTIVGTALVVIVAAIARPRAFGLKQPPPRSYFEDEALPVGGRENYDVFVSYKSHDAVVAREIVDRLIGSGISVWFAEYEVLLDRERFQEMYLAGIRNSRLGLAITNDRYVGSKYCREEMEELLERLGPSRVIEARLPPEDETHRTFPRLSESRQVEPTSVDDVVDFIRRETGFEIRQPASIDVSRPEPLGGRSFGGNYVLDAAGWSVDDRGGERLEDLTMQGPAFHLVGGEYRLVGNIFTGPEVAPEARREGRTSDDREMYEALLPHVRKHVGTLGADVRGVHLLFYGGFSQMLVTYRLAGYWARKYSVILESPGQDFPTEFVFTFGFFGPFREYCRHAHLLDRMVRTLQWA